MLGIVAALLAAAVPSFSNLLLDSRRNAAITSAMHAVNFARQYSATRSVTMILCGSEDARACTGDVSRIRGFLVSADSGGLQRFFPLAGGSGAPEIRSNRDVVRFEGSGFASPVTLTICDRRGAAAARAVIVSRSGRPRVSERDAGGEALAC